MGGIQLQVDLVQLEPLIRKVVAETLASLGAGDCGPGGLPAKDLNPEQTGALLWKPREAATALGISERTLWDLTRGNDVPHVRIGRAVRYAPEDLRAWVHARAVRGEGK